MSTEYPQLDGEKISYKGIFDLKELYEHLYKWLEWHRFDIEEKKYKEKVKAPEKDIEIEWAASKDFDEYSKMVIKVKWKASGISEVEVAKDDKKVKMNKGDIEISVSATLVTDKDDAWEVKPVLKFLKGFYEKYLYGSTIDVLKKKAWDSGWNFYNEAKAFLNLYRFG